MDPRFWYGEPFSHLPCSMEWQVVGVSNIHTYICMCVSVCVYTHWRRLGSSSLSSPCSGWDSGVCHNRWRHKLIPSSFWDRGAVLSGRECRRPPSPAAPLKQSPVHWWCRRWLWARWRHPAGALFPAEASVLEQAMGCLVQLLQRKLLVLPKRMLRVVTSNRAMSLKCLFPVLPWFPCKAIVSLWAVSLT